MAADMPATHCADCQPVPCPWWCERCGKHHPVTSMVTWCATKTAATQPLH